MNCDFLKTFQKDKTFLFSPDPPLWDGKMNAGVWAVRNNDKGRQIMDFWWKRYEVIANVWTKDPEKGWLCKGMP